MSSEDRELSKLLDDKLEEHEELTDEDKKQIKAQVDDLSSKVEKVSKEIVKILQDNNLTPIQSLLLLRALADGIVDMMNEVMEKERAKSSTSVNAA